MKKDNFQNKKRKVKIEGVEVQKCSNGFLSSKLGTYRATITVSRIAGAAFFLFFLIFGATSQDLLLLLVCGGAGLVMAALFCGLSWPLVSKVKAIDEELERRFAKDTTKKEVLTETAKQSGNRYKLIAMLAVPVGLVLAIVFLVSLDSGNEEEGCTICGKSATHSFQDSDYCEKHYIEAVKWAIDDVADKDD